MAKELGPVRLRRRPRRPCRLPRSSSEIQLPASAGPPIATRADPRPRRRCAPSRVRRHSLEHLPVDLVLLRLRSAAPGARSAETRIGRDRCPRRPAYRAVARSSANSIFASRRMWRPSAVAAGRRAIGFGACAGATIVGRCSRPRASVSSSGSMMISFSLPSMTTSCPGWIGRLASCSPTTAGTSSDRARMAV